MLFYDLSADNRITAVSHAWNSAAIANGGFGCVAKRVVGHNILDFVSGFQTQTYVNSLLFSARRSGKAVSTTYRCDTDTTARLLYMTVAPQDDGHLRVTHRDIPILASPQVPSFQGHILRAQCGQCYAVQLDNDWVGAGVGHDMLMQPYATGICPKCRAAAINAISANVRFGRPQVSPAQMA